MYAGDVDEIRDALDLGSEVDMDLDPTLRILSFNCL
jgi:hypothetical protein